jgi:hypothetical protein
MGFSQQSKSMITHEFMYSLNLLYLSQMVKAIYHNHHLHQINKITNFIIFLCNPHAKKSQQKEGLGL